MKTARPKSDTRRQSANPSGNPKTRKESKRQVGMATEPNQIERRRRTCAKRKINTVVFNESESCLDSKRLTNKYRNKTAGVGSLYISGLFDVIHSICNSM